MTNIIETTTPEVVVAERELDLQITAIESADTGLVFGAFAMNLRAVTATI